MPTVLRQEGFALRIYFDDHDPAHVHVVKSDEEVVISLGDETTRPWIRRNKGMKQKDMHRSLKIVAEHQSFLIAQWRSINE